MNYNRIIAGHSHKHFDECYNGSFIGVDFGINKDLSNELNDNFKNFTKKFRPIYLKSHPNKSKVAAGLACGSLWTTSYDLKIGDIILCPNGKGQYFVGELSSNYYYQPDSILPHRRKVKWFKKPIIRADMSKELQNSSGSVLTCCNLNKYEEEIHSLMKGEIITQ